MNDQNQKIKAIIGLGNPGHEYERTRHSVGFMIINALAERLGGCTWQEHDLYSSCEVEIFSHKLLLVKPLTFMNNSGRVMPLLAKKGIKAEQVLIIHDELERPFGSVMIKQGGSARGHNGLRSIIAASGEQFYRLRFGIGRPEHKEDVGRYVLQRFSEDTDKLDAAVEHAVQALISFVNG